MESRICRFCHRRFNGFSATCPECVNELDGKYIIVRNYLDKNRDGVNNVKSIADASGVDEKSLLYLIREGRLILKGEAATVSCLKCGAPIYSGKYCEKCKADLVRKLESTRDAMSGVLKQAEKPKAKQSDGMGRMHVLKDE